MKQRAAWLLSLLWQIVVCCPIALAIIMPASAREQSGTPSITPATQKLPDPVSSLAVDPHDERVAYALLVTHALYRTSDTGRTWQQLPLPAPEEHFNFPSDPERRNFFPLQQNIWLTPRFCEGGCGSHMAQRYGIGFYGEDASLAGNKE